MEVGGWKDGGGFHEMGGGALLTDGFVLRVLSLSSSSPPVEREISLRKTLVLRSRREGARCFSTHPFTFSLFPGRKKQYSSCGLVLVLGSSYPVRSGSNSSNVLSM